MCVRTEQPEAKKQTNEHRRSNVREGLEHYQAHGDSGQERPGISPFKQWNNSSNQADRTKKEERKKR